MGRGIFELSCEGSSNVGPLSSRRKKDNSLLRVEEVPESEVEGEGGKRERGL